MKFSFHKCHDNESMIWTVVSPHVETRDKNLRPGVSQRPAPLAAGLLQIIYRVAQLK